MRTTVELPDTLEHRIQKEKLQGLKKWYGKIDLGIDLDTLRKRA